MKSTTPLKPFHVRFLQILAAVLVTGLLGVAFAACSRSSEDGPTAAENNELIMYSTQQLWNDGGDGHSPIHIPVCFWLGDSTATSTHVDWAKYALTNSWNNTTNVVFDFRMCAAVPNGTKQVVVWISDGCCGKSGSGGIVNTGSGPAVMFDVALLGPGTWSVWLPTSGVPFLDDGGGGGAKVYPISQEMFKGVVVHEFGHILGFQHEIDQDAGYGDENYVPQDEAGKSPCSPNPGILPDGAVTHSNWPDRYLTPYDPDSIMNYCHQGFREYSGASATSIFRVYRRSMGLRDA